jgi:hypothetical protein
LFESMGDDLLLRFCPSILKKGTPHPTRKPNLGLNKGMIFTA